MPLYEYRCQDCKQEFEKLMSIGSRDRKVNCPLCGGSRTERAAISLFATSGRSTAGEDVAAASCAPAGGG